MIDAVMYGVILNAKNIKDKRLKARILCAQQALCAARAFLQMQPNDFHIAHMLEYLHAHIKVLCGDTKQGEVLAHPSV